MSEHGEFLPEAGMEWEREVRGYNRQQVDNYVAWRAGQVRELESRLSQSIGEIEHLRHEVAEARDAGGRPAHEEISDRFGRILKQAADAANAEQEKAIAEINQMRASAKAETDQLRVDVKQDTDRVRAEAQDRAERLLAAAQEQADRAVATAKAQAEDLMSSSQTAAEQMVTDANKHAESTIAAAVAQAKQHLDEATARATAIHDGAERRLNLLISRHTETVRRLTEIRDVVTSLVTGEANRGSLEDEVARALSSQPGANGSDGRTSGQHDAAPAGAHRAQRQAGPPEASRPGGPQADVIDGEPEQAAHGGRPAPDPLTDDRHDGGRYQGQPVDTAKRADRVLDDAAASSAGGRGVEG